MQSLDIQNQIVPKFSVIIPAYNEAGRIGKTITSVHTYLTSRGEPFEIVVVLNNCTDTTRGIVEQLMKFIPELSFIDMGIIQDHTGNTKGLAVREGMLRARGDMRLFTDADGSTPIEELMKLLPYQFEGYDVVFGSRRAPGANIVHDQPWYRIALGRIGNLLIRLLVLPGVRDTQCGFKLFSRNAAIRIFGNAHVVGWGFDIEALVLAKKLGFRFCEVGIDWYESSDTRLKSNAYFETFKELFHIWRKK